MSTMSLLMLLVALAGSSAGAATVEKSVMKELAAAKAPVVETFFDVENSQCTNLQKLMGVAYEQYEESPESEMEKLKLDYQGCGFCMTFNLSSAATDVLETPEFHPEQKVFVLVHGYNANPHQSAFGNISAALLSQGNHNILALDSSALLKGMYLRASTYVKFIGECLAAVLAAMVNRGINPSAIHVIGHSLGAHIAGLTGKTFTSLTGQKLGRITGLDPAGPCFSNVDSGLRLSAADAAFVDVVHTSAGGYGLKDNVGHAEYYPNSGSLQPNCLREACSHSRAWEYFTESVTQPEAFLAVKCDNWEAFKKNQCEDIISPMGFPSQPGTRGLYFLQTGDDSPYGLGEAGLTWANDEGVVRGILD